MVSITQDKTYTEQEYLALERKAENKSGFFNGEIFAHDGKIHNIVAGKFLATLVPKLRNTNCRPYGFDMRVQTPVNSLYAYPDISVVCGEKRFLDNEFDTLLNPAFICEVLSRSTADYDIGGKFMRYRSVDSLKEYWVISSLEYRCQAANGNWLLSGTTNVKDAVLIECLSTEISLNEIYREVQF